MRARRSAGRLLRSAVVGLLAGCVPTPAPFHVLETAAVLEKKEVALTVGAGLSFLGGGGGSLRARVGVGEGHEVGVEGAANGGLNGYGAGSAAARLSWKFAPTPRLALLANAGYLYLGEGNDTIRNLSFLTGDLGGIVSFGTFYAALRAGYGTALCTGSCGLLTWHGATVGWASAAPQRPRRVRGFFELGFVGSLVTKGGAASVAFVNVSDKLAYWPMAYMGGGVAIDMGAAGAQ